MYSLSFKHIRKNFATTSITRRLFDYNGYRQSLDNSLPERYVITNQKYLNDLAAIQNNQKEIAMRDWALNENKEQKTSALQREFNFDSRDDALNFMNVVKGKFDELDHHPEWVLNQNNGVSLRLTSHFNNNNVTPKDYELAAYLSQQYEQRGAYWIKFNRTRHDIFITLTAIVLGVAVVSYLWKMMILRKNYRITSRDFYFARIYMDSNDPLKEREVRKL
jgi:pterin-4a-carbinolamine dehydratase